MVCARGIFGAFVLLGNKILRRLEPGYQPVKKVRAPKAPIVKDESDDSSSAPVGMTFTPTCVSRAFRNGMALEYPKLGKNRAYWRFLQYLCFGSWPDVETGRLLLPSQFIATIEGKSFDSNYSAIKFMDSFQEVVGIKLDISDHIFSPEMDAGRVRMLNSMTLTDKAMALIEGERHSMDIDQVWMDSGNKRLKQHTGETRAKDKEKADGVLAIYNGCQETVDLCNYLNNKHLNRYSTMWKHMEDADALAATLHDSANQLNILKSIKVQPQPMYGTVPRSTRAFATNESVLRLHRDLRKILTQDWITADLRSAQLAIVAKVWEVPEIEQYLIAGQLSKRSIWDDLCAYMGLEMNSTNKAKVKTPLYSITFGAGRKRLHALFAREFGKGNGRQAYDKFRKHPIIRALLIARSRQLKAIRLAKGGTDAFGRFLKLEKRHKTGYVYMFDNSRSILACIAQSYELQLLLPVINLSMNEQLKEHGFTITTFLHDGFTFDSFKTADQQRWKDKLAQVVKEEADRLGIRTELEFEPS
jgi:hypothetical protein